MVDLNGKIALVTGSSRGIGRAVAIELARAGADVVVNCNRRVEEGRQVRSEIRGLGRRCTLVQADVCMPHELERLTHSNLGAIDILINNAGIARPQPFESITAADWHNVLDANLTSCFFMTQAVLPAMRERKWGRIVNISSVAAHVGGVVGPHYAASKAGLLGLTHFYASRLVKEGITVNAISPALIETEMVTSNPNASVDRIPVGRFGKPEEIAEVVLTLVGNGYITGQTIHVNGGWYMT